MLKGEEYSPLGQELISDRDACQRKLGGANNYSLSYGERLVTHLSRVITTQNTYHSSQIGQVTLQGKLGSGCHFDSPFHCTYGYNLHIGNNVFISANCTINDAGRVEIGDDVVIGINVTILTNSVPENPDKRRGKNCLYQARPVVIDPNVYIGPNVTICPGVRIKAGAYVMPGSVVTKVRPRPDLSAFSLRH
jgi:acetyltransferase-like isoleucine patch superfamily enzyme